MMRGFNEKGSAYFCFIVFISENKRTEVFSLFLYNFSKLHLDKAVPSRSSFFLIVVEFI